MDRGDQLVAKVGFKSLEKDVRYHFVACEEGRVSLASFTRLPEKRAYLSYLTAKDFDYGQEKQLIRKVEPSAIVFLPPWLENRAKDVIDDGAEIRKEIGAGEWPDWKVVDHRIEAIAPAIEDAARIFAEPDIDLALNREARRAGQNEKRFRLWVITYLAFGGRSSNRWVLLPATLGRGAPPLSESANQPMRGRHHHLGKEHGHNVTAAVECLITKGFRDYAKKGKFLVDVYADVLSYTFGCKTEDRNGETHIFHSHGEPFPSYGQFRYWVVKLLGHETVWSTLLGAQGYRNKFASPEGAYSEGVADLMEKVYADAAGSTEYPKSYFSNAPCLPLIEVPLVDALTGMELGAGFGQGGESERMYRQALAVVMMPKSLWGEVIGLTIRDEDWPVALRMPRGVQTDQGPGAAEKIRRINEAWGVSADMTGGYTPQSNSPVESTHEREAPTSGRPIHRVSKLTAVEMARQKTLKLMAANRSRDITARLTPELVAMKIRTPLQLWIYYSINDRLGGIPIRLEDVITGYLPQIEFTIKAGKLTSSGVIYRSAEFSGTTVGREIAKHAGKVLKGFAFDISNRIAWVLVGKELIKVSPVANVQAHTGDIVMTSFELALHEKQLNEIASSNAPRRHAEAVRLRAESIDLTGKPYRPSTIVQGRAKAKTPATKAEAAAARA